MKEKPFAITLDVGTSLLNHTGSWRTEKPVYVDRLPPCNDTCPAGENIQKWLYLTEEGLYQEAWQQIMEDNPFPSLMGRICYHPCESSCNRGVNDDPVGINGIERFLGEQGVRNAWKIEPGKPSGKKVMVIGAGPSGLSTAYHLRRFGHEVTVFESSEKAGGMMRYAIPKYRLPRDKLNAEIERLVDMGVSIQCNTRIDNIADEKRKGSYDAVFIAMGAQQANVLPSTLEGELKVLNALEVLRCIEEDKSTGMKGHVVVYGGGNTAVDIARSAVKLSALKATVIYHRSENYMSAHPDEIKEAIREGVEFVYLRKLNTVKGCTLELEIMAQGQGREVKPTGQQEFLKADVAIGALGQVVDASSLDALSSFEIVDGLLSIGPDFQTSIPGVFAGGDMTPSTRTVTSAIGQGKKAARNIDAYLKNNIYVKEAKHEVADTEFMNTWYYSDAPRTIRPVLDMLRRQSGFSEVVGNLTEEQAQYEARRCMSCGNCFECDNCYGMCPDNAVKKLGEGKGFEFKYDYCKGCGLCAKECPCGAIKMEAEDI